MTQPDRVAARESDLQPERGVKTDQFAIINEADVVRVFHLVEVMRGDKEGLPLSR